MSDSKSEDKIDITFDTESFKKAMDTIVENTSRMADHFDKTNNDVEKKDKKKNNALKKGFDNVVAFGIAKFAILRAGFTKLMSSVPEIGAVFKMAGDVALKNLMWPLRKTLIPLLQNVLNWVRDNRVIFLRLGTVIANMFRMATSVGRTFVNILKGLFKGLQESIGNVFNIKNITEAINLAMFKISLLFSFIAVKIQPFAEIIGKVFGQLVINVKDFVKGFVEGFTGAFDKKINVLNNLARIFEHIHTLLVKLNPLFEVLGAVVGTVVGGTIKLALDYTNMLLEGLNTLIDLITGKLTLKDLGTWFTEQWENMFGKGGNTTSSVIPYNPYGSMLPNAPGYNPYIKKVDDAIIKPDGSIIKTNPLDTIFAVKNPEKTTDLSGTHTKNISFGNITINLNVTEGNARKAGVNFANEFSQTFRDIIMNERLAQG